MDEKKLKKIKASLHRYANETHNTVGPDKKRDQYLTVFYHRLEKNDHPFEKEKLIEISKEESKKKKKKDEPKEEEKKKKDKKGKKGEVKEDIKEDEDKDNSKKKNKKGKKEEVTEEAKKVLDKNKNKNDKSKPKPEEKEEEPVGDLVPDITITDPDLHCVIDISAKTHMEKKDKKNAEKYEKYLKVPAFVINFGKKTGPVVKHWKKIKKLKYT